MGWAWVGDEKRDSCGNVMVESQSRMWRPWQRERMECCGAWTWQSINPGIRNWEGGWRVVRGRVEGRLCWERMVEIEEADTEVMRCVMMP